MNLDFRLNDLYKRKIELMDLLNEKYGSFPKSNHYNFPGTIIAEWNKVNKEINDIEERMICKC